MFATLKVTVCGPGRELPFTRGLHSMVLFHNIWKEVGFLLFVCCCKHYVNSIWDILVVNII